MLVKNLYFSDSDPEMENFLYIGKCINGKFSISELSDHFLEGSLTKKDQKYCGLSTLPMSGSNHLSFTKIPDIALPHVFVPCVDILLIRKHKVKFFNHILSYENNLET